MNPDTSTPEPASADDFTDEEILSFGKHVFTCRVTCGEVLTVYHVRGNSYSDAIENLELYLTYRGEVDPLTYISNLEVKMLKLLGPEHLLTVVRGIEQHGSYGVVIDD